MSAESNIVELHECFNCETHFSEADAILAGVEQEYAMQYCSSICQQAMQSYLEDSAQRAVDMGLIDEEGNPIRGTSIKEGAVALMDKFKVRIP